MVEYSPNSIFLNCVISLGAAQQEDESNIAYPQISLILHLPLALSKALNLQNHLKESVSLRPEYEGGSPDRSAIYS